MNKIIWSFSNKETTKENVVACVYSGWHNLVKDLIDDLFALGWDGQLFQVKEKFGGLRFYIGSGNQVIWDRITKAENDSYSICSVCGEPGQLRTDGWMTVLCDEHANGRPTEHSSF